MPIDITGKFQPSGGPGSFKLYDDADMEYATRTANTVFAGPTTGGAATPAFRALVAADIVALPGGVFSNPSGTIGLTANNGTATTAMRSDATPLLSQSIAPTWTGAHAWTTAGSVTVPDSVFSLTDNTTPSKVMQFQLSGLTASTTVTLTVPDASGTISLLDRAGGQTFTTAQTFNGETILSTMSTSGLSTFNGDAEFNAGVSVKDNSLLIYDEGDNSKQLAFQCSGVVGTRTLTVPNANGTIALTSDSGGSIDVARTWSTLQTFKDTTWNLVDATTASNTLAFDLPTSGGIVAVNATPTAGGTGYSVGNVLTVSVGGTGGTVTVMRVSGGVVQEVAFLPSNTPGSGYTTGSGKATTGGGANDCTVNITTVSSTGHDLTLWWNGSADRRLRLPNVTGTFPTLENAATWTDLQTFRPNTTTSNGLIIKALASQSAGEALLIQTNGGATLFSVSAVDGNTVFGGNLNFGQTTSGASMTHNNLAGEITQFVLGSGAAGNTVTWPVTDCTLVGRTSTALTSGRVPFVTTNGHLTDDADMTFATDTLTVTKIAATTLTGTLTFADAVNVVTNATTGTKIGTATTQKIAFHNSTPVAQRAGAAQAAVSTTGATSTTPFGYTTAAQADAIVTLVNEIRAALVEKGIIKGSA